MVDNAGMNTAISGTTSVSVTLVENRHLMASRTLVVNRHLMASRTYKLDGDLVIFFVVSTASISHSTTTHYHCADDEA